MRAVRYLVVLLVIALAGFGVSAKKASDPKDCEVCAAVLEEVGGMLSKAEQRDQAKVEDAIDTFCNKKELSQSYKKMCYYIEPIKRAVSHPFTTGIPKKKVCERLKKDNPDICSVKFPIKVEAGATDYAKMRVKELQKVLAQRGVDCTGCVEKSDFIKRCKETEHLEL